MNFEGKTVLITGGSRGLGAALARAFSQRKARVAIVARDVTALEETAATLRAEGGTVLPLAADVADKEAVYPIVGQVTELLGAPELLVNNASTLGPTPLRLLLDSDCEYFEAALAANLLGPFRLTKAVAGPMALRGSGIVVNISSDAAVEAYPRWGIYSVSKAALDHLTRAFAAELAETNVRFLVFDPGEMRTAMHAAAIPDSDEVALANPAVVAEKLVTLLEGGDAFTKTRWSAAELPPRRKL